MSELEKELDEAFRLISGIAVSGDGVELMAPIEVGDYLGQVLAKKPEKGEREDV